MKQIEEYVRNLNYPSITSLFFIDGYFMYVTSVNMSTMEFTFNYYNYTKEFNDWAHSALGENRFRRLNENINLDHTKALVPKGIVRPEGAKFFGFVTELDLDNKKGTCRYFRDDKEFNTWRNSIKRIYNELNDVGWDEE